MHKKLLHLCLYQSLILLFLHTFLIIIYLLIYIYLCKIYRPIQINMQSANATTTAGRSISKHSDIHHHSRPMSALLHTYFPPLFKNIFSSKPLKQMASPTPTSRMDLDGSFLPPVQSRNRICSKRGTWVLRAHHTTPSTAF